MVWWWDEMTGPTILVQKVMHLCFRPSKGMGDAPLVLKPVDGVMNSSGRWDVDCANETSSCVMNDRGLHPLGLLIALPSSTNCDKTALPVSVLTEKGKKIDQASFKLEENALRSREDGGRCHWHAWGWVGPSRGGKRERERERGSPRITFMSPWRGDPALTGMRYLCSQGSAIAG